MKPLFTISALFILLLSTSFAQENLSRVDVKLNMGMTRLGTGDMNVFHIENEISYRLNDWFSTSASLAYGKSDAGVSLTSSYYQLNANLFLSPFRNTGRHNFKIGGGLSGMNISEVRISSYATLPDGQVDIDHTYSNWNAGGFNIIIEHEYRFMDRYLIGGKLFTQPYTTGDINSGLLLKLGVSL